MAAAVPLPSSSHATPSSPIIRSFEGKVCGLLHANDDGRGLVYCASLLFDILLDCKALSPSAFATLSTTEKLQLHELCQDAIQAVGWQAQWRIAPSRDPGHEDWDALCRGWTPGVVATKMKEQDREDQLALRLHVLREDMCELWYMSHTDFGNTDLLDLANGILKLCSGDAMIAAFEEWKFIWLDAIKFPSGQPKAKLRMAVFDCVLLTLTCVSRWYASWFNSMIPASWHKRAVRLWAQNVPGTGAPAKRAPAIQQGLRASNRVPSRAQIVLFTMLEHNLQELVAIPWKSPTGVQADALGISSTSCWLERAAMAIGIVQRVIEGRDLKHDPHDKYFDDKLFAFGQKALDNMFIAAKIHFGVKATPTSPIIFQRSTSLHSRPREDDHVGLRRWQILRLLDGLHQRLPQMSARPRIAGLILQHVEGEGIISKMQGPGGIEDLPLSPVADKSLEWRTEMLRFAEFAIVGLAQHLSSKFRSREIMLMNRVVELDPRAWTAEKEWGAHGATGCVSFTDSNWSMLLEHWEAAWLKRELANAFARVEQREEALRWLDLESRLALDEE